MMLQRYAMLAATASTHQALPVPQDLSHRQRHPLPLRLPKHVPKSSIRNTVRSLMRRYSRVIWITLIALIFVEELKSVLVASGVLAEH
jgi:hypothetical protein